MSGAHTNNLKKYRTHEIYTFSPTLIKYKDLARWASRTSLSPKFSSASAILDKEEKSTKRSY